ncbi:MAG: hypothetical protein ABEH78_08195 [Haloferacaceae archaeon]
MTDRIDLDELAEESDEEGDRPNRGDWFWRDEDGPPSEPAPERIADDAGARESDTRTPAADSSEPETDTAAGGPSSPVPHVPRKNQDRPVGIPKEGGGAGGGPTKDQQHEGAPVDEPSTETPTEGAEAIGEGPHGGGVDDMTMALTYRAAQRLADPAAALADASRWADWLGIVGDVDAHVITNFQRDHRIDVDFFNGSGAGPGERLADIDEHTMFFAERMVVVGLDGEEHIAEEAGWEFVPLSAAAEKAGWRLANAE